MAASQNFRRIQTGRLHPVLRYFHGDNGAGLAANHQTGWTASSPRHASVCHHQCVTGASSWQGGRHYESSQADETPANSRAGCGPKAMKNLEPPVILRCFKANTRVWLTELARGLRRPATLDDIPRILSWIGSPKPGFRWIWFFERLGKPVRRDGEFPEHPEWRKEFQETLPIPRGRHPGSGFAITGYTVAETLGGDRHWPVCVNGSQSRPEADARLCSHHMALDHPWIEEHPEYFIQGSGTGIRPARRRIIFGSASARQSAARARTRPVFPRLSDTLQLNYANPPRRRSWRRVGEIAGQCDGVALRHGHAHLPGRF